MKYTFKEFLTLLAKFPEDEKLRLVKRHIADVQEYMQSDGTVKTLAMIAKQCAVKENAYQISLLFLDKLKTPQEARAVGRTLGKWAKSFQEEFKKASTNDNSEHKFQTLPEFLRYLKSFSKSTRLQTIEFHADDVRHLMLINEQDATEVLMQILGQLPNSDDAYKAALVFKDSVKTPDAIKKIGDMLGDHKRSFHVDIERYWTFDKNQPIQYHNYEEFLSSIATLADYNLDTFFYYHKDDVSRFVDQKGLMQVFNDSVKACYSPATDYTFWTKYYIACGLAHKITTVEQMYEIGGLVGDHAPRFYVMADLVSQINKPLPQQTNAEPKVKLSRSHSSLFITDKPASVEPSSEQDDCKRQRLT